MRLSSRLALACLVLPAALPVAAEQLISDTLVVSGSLCAGAACASGETFENGTIKFRQNAVRVHFDDASAIAQIDWQIEINDGSQTGPNYFAINDVTTGTTPFSIQGGAPDTSLLIGDHGDVGFAAGFVGIGTIFPVENLHIVDSTTPTILFETANGSVDRWGLEGDQNAFSLTDRSTSFPRYPFLVERGSESFALRVGDDAVAIGTHLPQAKLHVDLDPLDATYPYGLVIGDGENGTDQPSAMAQIMSGLGNAQLRIEENYYFTNPRTLLNLTNNGRPEITMANTATNGEWSFGAGTDFFLKVGTIGSPSRAKDKILTAKANGDVIVAGTLTTGGTTCGGGCDRVFTDHAIIPAPDYAAQMWTQGHLPHVGPTVEGAPLNVSEKLGGMLNALEHAHVFIDAQNARIRAQDARIAELERLVTDLIATR